MSDVERFGAKRMWLVIERESGNEERGLQPSRCGGHGVVDGVCPGCGAEPFRIVTEPRQIVNHDTAKYGARCLVCHDPVGWAYARLNTIFGLEEDRAVLDKDHQRARVYR